MKGPGVRTESDVRRVWRCPSCGQTQRESLELTFVRCGCVRAGMPMKLVEELKSPRLVLRPEARAVIDRLLAGEVIPRLVSALYPPQDSEFPDGPSDNRRGGHSSARQPRRERDNGPQRDPSSESQPTQPQLPMVLDQPLIETPPTASSNPEGPEPFGVGM